MIANIILLDTVSEHGTKTSLLSDALSLSVEIGCIVGAVPATTDF